MMTRLYQACLLGLMLYVSTLASVAIATPASMKFAIQRKTVETIANVVNPLLLQKLDNLTVPDQEVSKLGIHIYLRQIELHNFNFTSQQVNFIAPDMISVSFGGVSLSTTMNWEYKDITIGFKGTADDDVSDTTFDLTFTLSSTSNGKAQAAVSADVNIGSLDIHLHGPGSSLFEMIAKLITPLIKDAIESTISSTLNKEASALINPLLASVPTELPLGKIGSLFFPLIKNVNPHQLAGSYYSNNHFSGSESYVAYKNLDHISIDNYQSFDVSGYYKPSTNGTYTFQIHYTQRGEVDVNGQTAGSLEMHNPGMCWPEHFTHTTNPIAMTTAEFYPMRLRYQSGCGGGWVELRRCDAGGNNCQPINPDNIDTAKATDTPFEMFPNYVLLSIAAAVRGPGLNASTDTDPSAHHQLPNTVANEDAFFTVTFDDFVFDSLLYTLQKDGVLSAANLSSPSFNTTVLRTFIPDLYAHYPNAPIVADLSVSDKPNITFSDLGLSIDVPLYISLGVMQNGSLITDVIDMHANISVGVAVQFANNNITLKLAAHVDLKVTQEKVSFNGTQFTPFVNAILQSALIDPLNAKLAPGIELPYILDGTVLAFANHSFMLSLDMAGGAEELPPQDVHYILSKHMRLHVDRIVSALPAPLQELVWRALDA